MKISGYKAFEENMCNQYGEQFEQGHTYRRSGIISFGTKGNGYHFCAHIEDTFRYYSTIPFNSEEYQNYGDIKIARVIGSGNIVESYDDWYGYYNMYAAEILYIEHILTREEVIDEGLKLDIMRMARFVSTFLLMENEIESFRNIHPYIDGLINYYQFGYYAKLQREKMKQKKLR